MTEPGSHRITWRPSQHAASNDTDRDHLERLALLRLLVAARHANITPAHICQTAGLRGITLHSGPWNVTVTYPIYFAPDNTPVSWQIDVEPAQPDSTGSEAGSRAGSSAGEGCSFMSGLTVRDRHSDVQTMLATLADPNLLSLTRLLIDSGEDPALVLAAPFT